MKKLFNLFLLTVMVGAMYAPAVSAFTFSNPIGPKTRVDGSTPIYYLDIKSPSNTGGRVPASYKSYNAGPLEWEKLANKEYALKDEVWNHVWEWSNQPLGSDAFITPMQPLTWSGDLQSSINGSLRNIKRANPDYYAKEVLVYPIHKERSYPISITDALLKMSRDNYYNDISEISDIDC